MEYMKHGTHMSNAEELKQKVLNCKDFLNDFETHNARLQIQKIYKQLLILDLEYCINKKIEHDLWNAGFKNYIDCVQKLVKNKDNPKRAEHQALFSLCLEAASGFYLVFLEDICTTFSIQLPFSRNALAICPNSGQPYNQLAVLETCRGDKLATVYYYMRSIAVSSPFPVAMSNLTLTLNKINAEELDDEISNVLPTPEFVTLFLKLHCLLHSATNLDKCSTYTRLLTTSLTAHVATESFTSINLLQMMIINMFVYYNATTVTKENTKNEDDDDGAEQIDEENKQNEQTDQEKVQIKSYLVEMIAGSLNAFLLPIYTYKQEDNFLQYFALPAIKITLDWLSLNLDVLKEPGFVNRPQLWTAFCKLLNSFEKPLSMFIGEKYAKNTLPEEQDVQGFIPLISIIPEYNHNHSELDLDTLNQLRAYRIRKLALRLIDEKKANFLKVKRSKGIMEFEATVNSNHLTNNIIQEINELLCKDLTLDENSSDKFTSISSSTVEKTKKEDGVADVTNKKIGILKTQKSATEEVQNQAEKNKKKTRQNVAMQTILKRKKEQEPKQVTFKTTTPTPGTSTSNEYAPPPATWQPPVTPQAPPETPKAPFVQPYRPPFPPRLPPPPANFGEQFYRPSLNDFARKPTPVGREFTQRSNGMNGINVPDQNAHHALNPFTQNAPRPPVPWPQEPSNTWWNEEKQKIAADSNAPVNRNVGAEFYPFRYRDGPSFPPSSQPIMPPPFNDNGQPGPPRTFAHPSQPPPQHPPLPPMFQKPQNMWPNSFIGHNNMNAGNGGFNPFNYNQPNPNENKVNCPPNPIPNSSYSLFNNSIWGSSGLMVNSSQPNNNPLSALTQRSIWSEEVSPLQRLLEKQKQMHDNTSALHAANNRQS